MAGYEHIIVYVLSTYVLLLKAIYLPLCSDLILSLIEFLIDCNHDNPQGAIH